MCTILFPGWYTFRYFFNEAVIPLLLAFQGSMIRLRQLRSLLVWPLNLFDFHLLSFGSASWRWMECRFWCILTVDVPLYNTSAYFGSGYLISELCPACLTGISGCFFSLVFLFACFSFFCSLWLAFQVLPGPCNLHRPGGIPRIALGKGGKKKEKKKKKKVNAELVSPTDYTPHLPKLLTCCSHCRLHPRPVRLRHDLNLHLLCLRCSRTTTTRPDD